MLVLDTTRHEHDSTSPTKAPKCKDHMHVVHFQGTKRFIRAPAPVHQAQGGKKSDRLLYSIFEPAPRDKDLSFIVMWKYFLPLKELSSWV